MRVGSKLWNEVPDDLIVMLAAENMPQACPDKWEKISPVRVALAQGQQSELLTFWRIFLRALELEVCKLSFNELWILLIGRDLS